MKRWITPVLILAACVALVLDLLAVLACITALKFGGYL